LLADCGYQHGPPNAAGVVGGQQQAVEAQAQHAAVLAAQPVIDVACHVDDEHPEHKHTQGPAMVKAGVQG
jgi:hypothetical protein